MVIEFLFKSTIRLYIFLMLATWQHPLSGAGLSYEISLSGQDGHRLSLSNGGTHQIDITMNATLKVIPFNISCNQHQFLSSWADITGQFEFTVTAKSTAPGQSLTRQYNVSKDWSWTDSKTESNVTPNPGDHLYIKTNDDVFVFDQEITIYGVEYVSELNVARVWLSLPPPFNYESKFEHYDFPAAHQINIPYDFPSCLTGQLIDQVTRAPIDGAVVRLDDESEVITDDQGTFSFVGVGPGVMRLDFGHEDYLDSFEVIHLNPFDVQNYRFLVEARPSEADLVPEIVWETKNGKMLPGITRNAKVSIKNVGLDPAIGPVGMNIYLTGDSNNDPKVLLYSNQVQLFLAGNEVETMVLPLELLATEEGILASAGKRRLLVELETADEELDSVTWNSYNYSSTFWMGEFIYVVTHGFKPIPFQKWGDFRLTSREIGGAIRRMFAESPALDGRMVEYISEWDSATGFLEAFTLLFVAKVADAFEANHHDGPDFEKAILANEVSFKLKQLAAEQAVKSRTLAYGAGNEIFLDLLEDRYLMSDRKISAQFQRIQLIGHSRGAAVNAYLSNRLQNHGFFVGDFISLDGFSEDWPDDADLIADFDISNLTIAARKTNFQVERELDDYIVDLIEFDNPLQQLVFELTLELIKEVDDNKFLKGIASLYPSRELRDQLRQLHLKAPSRQAFGFKDVTLQGIGELSHHVNIQQAFLDRHVYSADDYMGIFRFLNDPSAFLKMTPQTVDPSTSTMRMLQESTTTADWGFRDGSFSNLHQSLSYFGGLGQDPTGEPLIDAWVDILSSPGQQMKLAWETEGDVQIITDGDETFAQLSYPDISKIGQLVDFPFDSGTYQLGFDISIPSMLGRADLEVQVDGQAAQSLSLAISPKQIKKSFDLNISSGVHQIDFVLTGDTSASATVALDNLAFTHIPQDSLRIEVQRTQDGVLVLKLDGMISGYGHSIQASNDLRNWTTIRELEVGELDFTLPDSALEGNHMFYRVQSKALAQ